jgi:DNA gyrase subunit A
LPSRVRLGLLHRGPDATIAQAQIEPVSPFDGRDGGHGIAAIVEDRDQWLLTVTENGYGKRTAINDYRIQSRNGKGLIDIKTNERNGAVSAINAVSAGHNLVLMSEAGKILRTRVDDVSIVGRNTMGVQVMDLDAGDRVAAVDVLESIEGGSETTAESDRDE